MLSRQVGFLPSWALHFLLGGLGPGLVPDAWTEAGAPHSPQNFSLPTRAAPHDAHESASGAPHSMQNFFPCGFSVAQLGQGMSRGAYPRREAQRGLAARPVTGS